MNNEVLEEYRSKGPVMIVDDDEAFRHELKSVLEEAGLSVIVQDSGSHAVRFLQNQPWNWYPALVFTDLVMDGMGGYQFIRRVSELYTKRDVPVVVISRLDAGVDVGEAEVAGAAAYLTKPLDKDKLFETIRKIFSKERKGMLVFTSDYGRRKAGKKPS